MNINVDPPHRLICVAPADIQRVWPAVALMIDEGYADDGETMPANLPEWLAAGKGQLWLSIDGEKIVAALTTSIEPQRHGLRLRMVSCGGSRMDLWKDCHRQIEQFARDEGCDRIRIEGRAGWQRVLTGSDYRVTRVTLEKRL